MYTQAYMHQKVIFFPVVFTLLPNELEALTMRQLLQDGRIPCGLLVILLCPYDEFRETPSRSTSTASLNESRFRNCLIRLSVWSKTTFQGSR